MFRARLTELPKKIISVYALLSRLLPIDRVSYKFLGTSVALSVKPYHQTTLLFNSIPA